MSTIKTKELLEALERLAQALPEFDLPLVKSLQGFPYSALVGYELKLISLPEPLTLESINDKYKGKAPILIKAKDSGKYYFYGNDLQGKPQLHKVNSKEFKAICHNLTFSSKLKSLENISPKQVNLIRALNYHFVSPKIAHALENIDTNVLERMFKVLVENNLTIDTNTAEKLYIRYLQQNNTNCPYAVMYFMTHLQNMGALVNLLHINKDKVLVPENVNFLRNYLLDANTNPSVKANLLLNMPHDLALLILDEPPLDSYMPTMISSLIGYFYPKEEIENPHEILFDRIFKNQNWLANSILLKKIERPSFNSSVKLNKETIDRVTDSVVLAYSDTLIEDQVTESDFNQLYDKTNDFNETQICIAEKTVHYLNNNQYPLGKLFTFAYTHIFSKIENLKSTDRFTLIQSNIVLYIINHFEELKDFIHANPKLLERVNNYPLTEAHFKQLNLDALLNYQSDNINDIALKKKLINTLGTILAKNCDKYSTPPNSKMMSHFAPQFYQLSLNNLATMIFPTNVEYSNQTAKETPLYNVKFIANNDAYLATSKSNAAPLFLDKDNTIPIGYTIYFPPTKIKNVFINVYGGHSAKEREKRARHPGFLQNYETHLLKEGSVVVTLNLPDLLKLDTYQGEMKGDLYFEIQKCIHHFFKTLKSNPEIIHEELTQFNFDTLDMYLYGASFGGAVAIRHAQLFPGTFNGYISHNGDIAHEMAEKSDTHNRPRSKNWLDPSVESEIKKLQDHILLLHNKNDSNVSAKDTLYFYQLLKKFGKADLARVHISEIGNPIPISSDMVNRGHFIPTEPQIYADYVATIDDFMQYGHSLVPSVTPWQAYIHDQLMNSHFKSATLQEQFIAKVMENKLKTNPSTEEWEQHYRPLYYALLYAKALATDPVKFNYEVNRLIEHNLLTDKVLQKTLQMQAKSFIQYLKEKYNITLPQDYFTKMNEDINALLKARITTLKAIPKVKPAEDEDEFLSFSDSEDYYSMEDDSDSESALEDKKKEEKIQSDSEDEFLSLDSDPDEQFYSIESDDSDSENEAGLEYDFTFDDKTPVTEQSLFDRYLLSLLYQANLSLLAPLHPSFKTKEIEESLDNAKRALKEVGKTHRKHMVTVWEEASKKIHKEQQDRVSIIFSKINNLLSTVDISNIQSFNEIINLSQLYATNPKKLKIILKLNDLIVHLEKISDKTPAIIDNLIFAKLSSAIIINAPNNTKLVLEELEKSFPQNDIRATYNKLSQPLKFSFRH